MNTMYYKHFISFLLLIVLMNSSSAQDYTKYHTAIIEAERQVFVEEQLQEGLNTYQKTFKQYDFVFLTDVLHAMQIALLLNDEHVFLTLADKATQNGLLPRHLINFSFIKKHPFYAKHKDSIISLYRINRPHYLSRIDTVALVKMYDLYAYDQMQKSTKKGERQDASSKRYNIEVAETRKELIELISTRGFPSDKIIGIYQKDIVRELGLVSGKDLIYYYYDNKDQQNYNIGKGQFEYYEWIFSSKLFAPIMEHYYTIHRVMQEESDEFYLEQIKLGNVHPRDLAETFDFACTANHEGTLDTLPSYAKLFLIIRQLGLEQKDNYKGISYTQINKYRKKFYIAPLEQDFAKIKFAKKYGIYVVYASNGSR